MQQIRVSLISLDDAVERNSFINEFREANAPYDAGYFLKRIGNARPLILGVDLLIDGVWQKAGYGVAFDKAESGYFEVRYVDIDRQQNAFYCDMAGIDNRFRKNGGIQALWDARLLVAHELGYSALSLTTWEKRIPLQRAAQRYGFNLLEALDRDKNGDPYKEGERRLVYVLPFGEEIVSRAITHAETNGFRFDKEKWLSATIPDVLENRYA